MSLKEFQATFLEVLQAIAPIALLMLIFDLLFVETSALAVVQFLVGAAMVLIGIVFFLIGVKIGLLPIGEAIGSDLPKRGSILLIATVAFLFGFFCTVAEPDVRVLTAMIDALSHGDIARNPLIFVIAVGVGFFFSTALLRIVFRVPIELLLVAGYMAVMILSLVTPLEYIPISFDAGGVTTGPLTVPFMLALGMGTSTVLSGRSPVSDGFGLIGLASIGPILGVMLLGVVSS